MQLVIASNDQLVRWEIEGIGSHRIFKSILRHLRTALRIPDGDLDRTDIPRRSEVELDIIGAVLRVEQETGKICCHGTRRAKVIRIGRDADGLAYGGLAILQCNLSL